MNRWRWAAATGLAASVALVALGGGGALVIIAPAWLVGLALRCDNRTGSLVFLATLIGIVVLVMLGLVALLAIGR